MISPGVYSIAFSSRTEACISCWPVMNHTSRLTLHRNDSPEQKSLKLGSLYWDGKSLSIYSLMSASDKGGCLLFEPHQLLACRRALSICRWRMLLSPNKNCRWEPMSAVWHGQVSRAMAWICQEQTRKYSSTLAPELIITFLYTSLP